MTKKIKLINVLSPLTIAGAERVILTLTNNIDKDRFDVSLCLLLNAKKTVNPFVEKIKELNIKYDIIPLDKVFSIKQIKQLNKIIRNNSIDIIHTHSHRADITSYFANYNYQAKIISTVHGWTKSTGKLKIYSLIDKIILRNFDAIITVSNEIQRELIKYRIKQKKIYTIYNSLDYNDYKLDTNSDKLKSKISLDKNIKIIGTIGRLSKEKDIDTFIYVAKKLLELRDDIRFIIVGDGPERDNIIKLIDKLRIKDKIYLMGYYNEIAQVYDAIDIFLLTSTSEGLPICLLETCYFGKPFIATNVGGIPEIFNNIGIIVKRGDIQSISHHLIDLLDNQEIYNNYSKNLRQYILLNHNPKEWVKKIESLYLKLYCNQI